MGTCSSSIIIHSNAYRVWNTIREFNDLSWAPSIVKKLEIPKKDERIINDVFYETLLTVDEDRLTLTYRIDDGPGPVSKDNIDSYIGTIVVSPTAYGTNVEWSSEYSAKEEDGVRDFCNPIYQALLMELKIFFEQN